MVKIKQLNPGPSNWMPSWTATAVGDSVTGTSKVYKRNEQDWTNILLLTSKLVILVLQDQPNKIVFF